MTDSTERQRRGGPSTVWSDGTQEWVDGNGKFHRIDGPAIIWADGREEWYLFGEEYTDLKVFEAAASMLLMLFPELN